MIFQYLFQLQSGFMILFGFRIDELFWMHFVAELDIQLSFDDLFPFFAVLTAPDIIVKCGEILTTNDIHIVFLTHSVVEHNVVSSAFPFIVLADQFPFTGTGVLDTRWIQLPNIIIENGLVDVFETGRRVTTTGHPDMTFEESAHQSFSATPWA